MVVFCNHGYEKLTASDAVLQLRGTVMYSYIGGCCKQVYFSLDH